ncbi:MAG: T9SS type A sorting domain-containing protein, partial [bacterium]|nr:T9SS type A sorting domain-containing protein [bacterium]
ATNACGTDGTLPINITINDNTPPVLTVGPGQTVAECTNLNFTISATDVDNQPVTLSMTVNPTGGTFTPGTGVFDWTPVAGDAAGSPYTVTFQADDGCGGVVTDNVIITVSANTPPVLTVGPGQNVSECSNVNFTVSASDADNQPVTLSMTVNSTGGTFTPATGVFDWTPVAGDAAGSPYTVTFQADDGCGGVVTDDVIITVDPNTAPTNVFVPGGTSYTIAQCESVAFNVTSTDAEDGPLGIPSMRTDPGGPVNAILQNTGDFSWSADTITPGVYNFYFDTPLDACGDSTTTTVDITVTANGAPAFDKPDTTYDGMECTQLTFTLTATDPEADAMTFAVLDQPAPGLFDVNTGVFDWTPISGEAGTDTLMVEVTDGCVGADTITVELVIAPDQVPVFTIQADTFFTQGETMVITLAATDPEAGSITYFIDSTGFDEDTTRWDLTGNIFTWNSSFGTEGKTHTVTFFATDGCATTTGMAVNFAVATSVDGQDKDALPTEFYLAQNYPNPFNPITVIAFGLPEQSHVRLAIYNVLGQRIRTLIDEPRAAGSYEATWDGTGDGGMHISTGIYFYKLETDTYAETRKMVLMK